VFTSPAFAYLLVFEQESAGRLIWPAEKDLPAQHRVSRLIYPPLAGDAEALELPNTDGSTFIVVLISHEPLSSQALSELLHTPLRLNVSPQIAAHAQTCFQVAEPAPKFHQGVPTRGGSAASNATSLRVPEVFKRALHSRSDGYFGNLVPHVKAAARAVD
jgi:hypothetical protein